MEKYKDIYGILLLNRLDKANIDPIYPKKLNVFHQIASIDTPILPYIIVNPYDFLFEKYWDLFFNDANSYVF